MNPSLSVGGNLFYFDRAHRWAMGGEIGMAYTGGADISLTRTGTANPAIDDAMGRAEKRAQRFADQFKFWPVAKLSVTYSF